MTHDDACAVTGRLGAGIRVVGADGRSSSAVLSHDAGRLVLRVDDTAVLVGLCSDTSWRSRATALARDGRTLHVVHDGMHLLVLGAEVTAGVAVAGSPHMRVGDWPGARGLLGLPCAESGYEHMF